jgi:hypothetical protein
MAPASTAIKAAVLRMPVNRVRTGDIGAMFAANNHRRQKLSPLIDRH